MWALQIHFPQDIAQARHIDILHWHNMNNLLTITFGGKNTRTNYFPIYDQIVIVVEKNKLSKKHTDHLYFFKCIHRIYFMISKNDPLSENYRDTMNFIASKLDEPITKQYLESCRKNVTYSSCTAVESLKWSRFYKSVYADEAENSSYKETFSMFLRHYSLKAGKNTASFLGIVNWKGKTVGEIVDVIRKCFQTKNAKLDRIFSRSLDDPNSMSETKRGLQRRIRLYSPFNLYVNCRNHYLALCLSHLTKDSELGKLHMN